MVKSIRKKRDIKTILMVKGIREKGDIKTILQ